MMEPWELANSDQMHTGCREFARLSWALYTEYQKAGFDEESAFEIVRLWNEQFSHLACRTS